MFTRLLLHPAVLGKSSTLYSNSLLLTSVWHRQFYFTVASNTLQTQQCSLLCHGIRSSFKKISPTATRSTTSVNFGFAVAFQPYSCQNRNFSTQPQLDPNKNTRRRRLTLATYFSCFIGVCLLSAVGYRQYGRIKQKAIGMEELKLKEYSFGRRAFLSTYRGYVLTSFFARNMRDIHTFEVREDDVWVVTFPKAGTTWVQEIVYLVMNDADTEKAKQETINVRVPYLEYPYPGVKFVAGLPSPRIIKSHMPLSLLPNEMKTKKPKIVYVARNPKDTVVSYHSFMTKFLATVPFTGSFEEFCQLFATDKTLYGPWWKHVSEAWQRKDDDNILFVTYEDLSENTERVVQTIAEFLGRPLSTKQVSTIVEHCRYENMKKSSGSNYEWMKETGEARKEGSFYRKGQVGDWKNHLSEEIVKQLDEMVATKLPPGLVFRDSLYEDVQEKQKSRL